MNYRKLTPSMSLLLAFEASARHQSFTRAAQELALTQSAVSRQVQALESMLELQLFHREGKRIVTTDVGHAYMTEIARALTSIRNATLQALTAQSAPTCLRVATLPTFGAKWLLPRLHEFYGGRYRCRAVPRMLVEDELKDGRLVSPLSAVPSSRSYFLVYPERVARHPALMVFRDWLLQQLTSGERDPVQQATPARSLP